MKNRLLKFMCFFTFILLNKFFVFSNSVNAKIYISTSEEYYDSGNINIVGEDYLNKGYLYRNVHKEFKVDSDLIIENIVYLHTDEYLVLGMSSGLPYVSYYKEGNKIFENKIFDSINGKFVDAIFEDDKIVLLGEVRKTDKISRILIEEYSYNGISLRKQEIMGDNDSFAKRIFKINNCYYFTGETMSKMIDGCYNDSLRSILIGRISELDFSDYYIISFGNGDYNTLYDCIYLKNEIFLLIHFSGKGYFLSGNTSNEFFAIVKFDEQLDMPMYYSLKRDKCDERSRLVSDGESALLVSVVEKYKIGIGKWNMGLDKIDYLEYDLTKISDKIERIDVFYENNCLAVIATFSKNGCLWENEIILDKQYQKIYDSGLKNMGNKKVENVNYKNYFFNILYSSLDTDEFEMISEVYIKKKDNRIFINGKEIINKKTEENSTEFGEKEVYEEYVTKDINILIKSKISAPLKTNVKNFSVYDVGLKLEFNAIGYLNGKQIENNYIINESGNYLLELYGISGEKESIYFIVDNLTVSDIEEEVQTKSSLTFENVFDKKTNSTNTVNNEVKSDTLVLKNDWSFLIVSLVVGVISGTVISKLINRRKKYA